MLLRYINPEGRLIEYEMGPDVITIGRAPDATVVVQGEKVSRYHCGIRAWDRDFILKDYGSTNGTFVNEIRVPVAVIKPGDVIRLGSVHIQVDLKSNKGAKTILRELSQEMEEGGKGYRTMLREIVDSTTPPADNKREPAQPGAETTGPTDLKE
jgi:pSer/pThr/pTyr-binding forkhead associated (FHA) protein